MSEYIVNLEGELGLALAVACSGAGFAREKVVRCSDCAKWHEFDYEDGKRYGECDEWKRPDSYCTPATAEDGFCAWGERRSE